VAIEYQINPKLSVDEFADLLHRSGLAERRPVDDRECLSAMVENGNLVVSATEAGQLIGIARSITDFSYACYLSDLAVDHHYQKKGIGKKLMQLSQQQLGPKCKLILLAAPAAKDYYSHVGFNHHPGCWTLDANQAIG